MTQVSLFPKLLKLPPFIAPLPIYLASILKPTKAQITRGGPASERFAPLFILTENGLHYQENNFIVHKRANYHKTSFVAHIESSDKG